MTHSQPPGILTPRAPKLQPRRIAHPHHPAPQVPALAPQQDLRDGLPPRAEVPQHDLQLLDLRQQAQLLDPPHDVRAQLVGGVVGAARRFAEADRAGGHGDDGVAVGFCESDVCVVARAVDVQVVRLRQDGVVGGEAGGGGDVGGRGVVFDVVVDAVDGGGGGARG